jgi:hypothetical protein
VIGIGVGCLDADIESGGVIAGASTRYNGSYDGVVKDQPWSC